MKEKGTNKKSYRGEPGRIFIAAYFVNYVTLSVSVLSLLFLIFMGKDTLVKTDQVLADIPLITFPFTIILWIYCLWFYYKFDRYSKRGIWLFLLSWAYSAWYFYNVIWKKKIKPENRIKVKPAPKGEVFWETEE